MLERLAGVLEIPYWTLMDLAGYVPAGQAGPPRRAGRKENNVSHQSGTESPTNAEIVRLLQEITAELQRLEHNQDGLARLLEKAESPQLRPTPRRADRGHPPARLTGRDGLLDKPEAEPVHAAGAVRHHHDCCAALVASFDSWPGSVTSQNPTMLMP